MFAPPPDATVLQSRVVSCFVIACALLPALEFVFLRGGDEFKMSAVQDEPVATHVVSQVITAKQDPKARFDALARQWRDETGHLSSVTQKALHPSYQKIIGMGQQAVPLILQELQHKPSPHWFWTLDALVEDTPNQLSQAENLSAQQVREIWLQWGRAKGLLP